MRRLLLPVLAVLAAALVAGCGSAPAPRFVAPSAGAEAGTSAGASGPVAPAGGSAGPAAPVDGRAPGSTFAVGLRTLQLRNGSTRPLPTTVYYPATGSTPVGTARAGAPVAPGRFPVVVFSHGLSGLPAVYAGLLTRWAAAGFVVAAPAYPHTSFGVVAFDLLDVVNQPADASAVLTGVLGLSPSDALSGHIDASRAAAAGHSAGGITTVGLFTAHRDARLRAGIVLAGNGLGMGDVYSGQSASLFFVHGRKDPTVSYASGRAAYEHVPWTKAMLTLPNDGHTDPYLRTGATSFVAVAAATTDFLRFTLYGDAAARARIGADAGTVGSVEDRL